MKLTDFRHRFPEYDDMPDAEVAVVLSELFPAPQNDSKLSEAIEVLAESFKSLEKALANPPKAVKEKAVDYSPLMLVLAEQLAKVETAISGFTIPETVIPEVKIPEPKQVKSLKVKRNELGYIVEVIPVY